VIGIDKAVIILWNVLKYVK